MRPRSADVCKQNHLDNATILKKHSVNAYAEHLDMKKTDSRHPVSRRAFAASLATAPWIARAQPSPLTATLTINTERTVGDIDPKIYGNFIEHLGRCIYGGVFEEGSPLSDADGDRRD